MTKKPDIDKALDMVADVRAFHRQFGVVMSNVPRHPPAEIESLRLALIREEFDELQAAVAARDITGIADGIVDMMYVLTGMALVYGLPLDEVWSEVHATNMAKTGGAIRDDGKILKPEGWRPPDVRGLLARRVLERFCTPDEEGCYTAPDGRCLGSPDCPCSGRFYAVTGEALPPETLRELALQHLTDLGLSLPLD